MPGLYEAQPLPLPDLGAEDPPLLEFPPELLGQEPLPELEFPPEFVGQALPTDPGVIDQALEFPPDVVGPGAAASQEAAALEAMATKKSRIAQRRAELAERYAGTESAKERAALAKRITALDGASVGIDDAIGVGRQAYDEQAQVAATRAEAQKHQAALTAHEAARRRQQELDRRQAAESLQMDQDRTAAQDELRRDRETYRRALREGPKRDAGWGSMLAELVGEQAMAIVQRRPPDIDGIVERYRERQDQEWKNQLTATLDEVQEGSDELARLAAAERRGESDAVKQRAAILAELEQDLTIEAQRAAVDTSGLAALAARDGVRRQREIAEAQAEEAAIDNRLRRRKLGADIALKESQARKTGLEAARLGATGPGGGQGEFFGDLDPKGVYLPGTGKQIARIKDPKRAAKAQAAITNADNFLNSVNRYISMVKDYGRRGYFADKSFAETPEFADLKAMQKLLATPLAKVLAGGYNPSAAIEEKAEGLVPLPEGWWQKEGVTVTTLERLSKEAEEQFRSGAGQILSPAAAQQYIEFRRSKKTSKRETAEAAAKAATKTAVDASKDPETRRAAVGMIIDRAREKPGDWVASGGHDLLLTWKRLKKEKPGPGKEATLDAIEHEMAKIIRIANERVDNRPPPRFRDVSGAFRDAESRATRAEALLKDIRKTVLGE